MQLKTLCEQLKVVRYKVSWPMIILMCLCIVAFLMLLLPSRRTVGTLLSPSYLGKA